MNESANIRTYVGQDGKLHLDVPVMAPPGSEVEVTVLVRSGIRFASQDAWRNHVKSIAGSVPDLERPGQPVSDPVEPI